MMSSKLQARLLILWGFSTCVNGKPLKNLKHSYLYVIPQSIRNELNINKYQIKRTVWQFESDCISHFFIQYWIIILGLQLANYILKVLNELHFQRKVRVVFSGTEYLF